MFKQSRLLLHLKQLFVVFFISLYTASWQGVKGTGKSKRWIYFKGHPQKRHFQMFVILLCSCATRLRPLSSILFVHRYHCLFKLFLCVVTVAISNHALSWMFCTPEEKVDKTKKLQLNLSKTWSLCHCTITISNLSLSFGWDPWRVL